MQVCTTEVVSFIDEEGSPVQWFSSAKTFGTNTQLDIFLDNTAREEFWSENQPFSISFSYTMKSTGAKFLTFKVIGRIEFSNGCLVNTVSAFAPLSYPLTNQLVVTPDLSSVFDSVSELYDINGLCGSFTIKTVICPAISG